MSNCERIRYAGKVRVRGMIRRVWRTRFIEIDSVGVLRYYETSEELQREDSSLKILNQTVNEDDHSLRDSISLGDTSRKSHSSGRSSTLRQHKRTISPEMQAFSLPVLFPEDDDEDYTQAEGDCSLIDSDQQYINDNSKRVASSLTSIADDEPIQKVGTVVSDHECLASTIHADSNSNPSHINGLIEDTWDHLGWDCSGGCANNIVGDTMSDAMDNCATNSSAQGTVIKSMIQSQSHHIHGHRPKATIFVRSARLLDPNSLRDMHLGLPKGKYGFIFHGSSIFSTVNLDNNQNHSMDDMCQSRFHFDDISDMSRDYLCAVNSLVEAETWVKELMWASLICRDYESKLRGRYLEMDDDAPDSFHHMGVFQNLRSHNRKNLIGDFNQDDQSLFLGSSQTLDSIESTFGSVIINSDKIKKDTTSPVIVIPKVRDIRYIPKRKRFIGVTLDIQAEIQILVTKSYASTDHIYEYTIFRSFTDIDTFFKSLEGIHLTGTSIIKNDKVAFSIDRDFLLLNDLNSKLRNVVSDRNICNSEKVKDFLMLTHNLKGSPLPTIAKHGETFTQLPNNQSLDDYVRKWINNVPERKRERFQNMKVILYLLLQDIRVEYILTLFLAYELCRILYWWWYILAVSVTIRLDWIIFIYTGSIYYAFVVGNRSARKIMIRNFNSPSPCKESTEPTSMDKIDSIREKTITASDSTVFQLSSQQSGSIINSIWSKPEDSIFKVRGATYLKDRTKVPSPQSPFECLAVDIYLTDNPERNIARHEFVFGETAPQEDVLVINFLLPFANFIAIFRVPPVTALAPHVAGVWTRFIEGDQQYRDSRLKLLSLVVDGPWIVKRAVGQGSAPALLGKVIPLQYFFSQGTPTRNFARYEIDIIITASRIANGILNVVKGHTKNMSIAFAFIIEGVTADELPETVLCSFQLNSVHLEKCPQLPDHDIMESDYE